MLPRSLSADSAGIRSHPIYLPVLRAPPPPLDPLVVFGGVEGCLLITSESPLTRHKLGGGIRRLRLGGNHQQFAILAFLNPVFSVFLRLAGIRLKGTQTKCGTTER